MTELIVRFRTGFEEDQARRALEEIGGFIRRRMRTDSTQELMLLARFDGDVEEKVKALPSVAWVERNASGFRPMPSTDC
ncbi:MAG: hypothetical protein AAGD10_00250 [Myxococcota bacterium]